MRRLLLAALFATSCGGSALKHAEALAWSDAQAAHTSVAYAHYVTTFPDGPHAAEARTTSERLAFEAALTDGSPSGLGAYIARHPGGPYTEEAKAALERSYVAEARAVGTEAAWGKVLMRYPEGAYAEEAHRERDRVAWNATTDAGTLPAHLRYLDDYPAGAHVEEATLFVAATRVGLIQPVIVLTRSYQPPEQHGRALTNWQKVIEKGMLAELRFDFEVRPTVTMLAVDPDAPRGRDAVRNEPGVGVLVVEIEERVGRPFEPSGAATDLRATVELLVPPTATPVVASTIDVSTPERVVGNTVSSLYTSAVEEMSAALRGEVPDIAAFREPR